MRASESLPADGGWPLLALVRPSWSPSSGGRTPRVSRLRLVAFWVAFLIPALVGATDHAAVILLLAAIGVSETLAAGDNVGAATLSGVLSVLALLVVGWPAGLVVALGTVVLGDNLLRGSRVTMLAWHAALLGAMLSAGAWAAGAAGLPASPWLPRAAALVWVAVYATWTASRARQGRHLLPLAQGTAIIAIITLALMAPAWEPLLDVRLRPWADAALLGLGFVSAFMLVDFAGASLAAWRGGGRAALAFWGEHLPMLFVRYGAQGVVAGLAAHWYALSGDGALVLAVGGLLLTQAAYYFWRDARATLESAIGALSLAIDARDPYTAGHSQRVAEYAARIAVHLGWSKGRTQRVRWAGLLHDVGKLGVADEVLHKPGPYTPAEYEHMQRHAAMGEAIVAQVRGLAQVARLVGQDHERWAGGGYPRGLQGVDILPEARLLAIADVFDAMTTDRPYRRALDEEEALAHLERQAGGQLDPDLTSAFVRAVRTQRAWGVAFCYCATH